MSPAVFISRSEERASAFIETVSPYASQIIAESLISFDTIKVPVIPPTEWLFFYSQTGADHFFEQHPTLDNKGIKIAAFGQKTGAYIQSKYHKVDFIGDGTTEQTASDFLSTQNPEQVCIVRGKKSINSLFPILSPHCDMSEMVVYDNSPKSSISIAKTDILVFTSPMNLSAYMDHDEIDRDQVVVVIGSTTAMTALKHGIDKVHIAKNPSMESLAESTINLCQTWSDI